MEDNREKYYRKKGWLVETGRTHDDLASNFYRTAGTMICDECGKEYHSHPYATEARSHDGSPYLHVLCNGDIIKT